jgi:DNA adenine methylase
VELNKAAMLLRGAKLVEAPFENTLSNLKEGDFAFIDPPYARGARDGDGFNRYSPDFFCLDDHERLGEIIESLDERRVKLMIFLGESKKILRRYPSSFERTRFRSKSLISGESSGRRLVGEVILTNYPVAEPRTN